MKDNLAISINNVTKYYSKKVLDGISLDVHQGDIFGILGGNGSGKTTLLNLIAGLQNPTCGNIIIHDDGIASKPIYFKKQMGFLTDEMKLYGKMTTLENLIFFADLYLIDKIKKKVIFEELIDKFNLSGILNSLVGKLSTGERQRVLFAKTMIHEPKVIILDEPTTGLDVINSQAIRDFILVLSKNKTILISTHNMDEVEALCNKICILAQTKIKFSGDLTKLEKQTGKSDLISSVISIIKDNEYKDNKGSY